MLGLGLRGGGKRGWGKDSRDSRHCWRRREATTTTTRTTGSDSEPRWHSAAEGRTGMGELDCWGIAYSFPSLYTSWGIYSKRNFGAPDRSPIPRHYTDPTPASPTRSHRRTSRSRRADVGGPISAPEPTLPSRVAAPIARAHAQCPPLLGYLSIAWDPR